MLCYEMKFISVRSKGKLTYKESLDALCYGTYAYALTSLTRASCVRFKIHDCSIAMNLVLSFIVHKRMYANMSSFLMEALLEATN